MEQRPARRYLLLLLRAFWGELLGYDRVPAPWHVAFDSRRLVEWPESDQLYRYFYRAVPACRRRFPHGLASRLAPQAAGLRRRMVLGCLWNRSGSGLCLAPRYFSGSGSCCRRVLLGRNSRLAAALLGLATTMKLWPGVLAAGLVGRFNARATWQRLSAFVASIVGICLLVIAFNDVERLISPLRYQEVRGLQVESIPATLPVFASHLFPDTWSIGYAASKSYEITGPWVSELLVLSNVLTLAMLFFALGFALMRFRNGNWGARSTLAFFITMICLLFISNKVFSTQYITWLGPILAVALKDAWPRASSVAHQHIDEKVGTVLRNLALCTLAAAALGTLVYPFNYDALLYAGRGGLFPAFLLLARNVLILVMTGLAFSWLRLELKRENTSSTKQAAQ